MAQIERNFRYRPDAPCAFCSSASPQHKVTHRSSTGTVLENVPCCDACKQNQQRQWRTIGIFSIVGLIIFASLFVWLGEFGPACGLSLFVLALPAIFLIVRPIRKKEEALKEWYDRYGL